MDAAAQHGKRKVGQSRCTNDISATAETNAFLLFGEEKA
jgi:hypothetical protein